MRKILLLKNRKGQNLVEFALLLPVLLMIVVGITDLSRLIYSKMLISQAAAEGLRIAATGAKVNLVADRIGKMAEPLIGETIRSIGEGRDNQGQSCTIITITPQSGSSEENVMAYITPTYTSNLHHGDKLCIMVTYKINFIIPLLDDVSIGDSEEFSELKAKVYTMVQSPPQ